MNNILMNTEMTKSILDGRKTQSRRVIKSHIDIHGDCNFSHKCSDGSFRFDSLNKNYFATINPKYQKDKIIWVREPARVMSYSEENLKVTIAYKADLKYKTIDVPDRFTDKYNWISAKWIKRYGSIPNGCIKEMARIFLKITDVKVERLNNIDKDELFNDINKEGWHLGIHQSRLQWWINLWNKTAPKGMKWEDNPYVFVYKFKRVNKDGSDYEQ